MAAGNYKNMNKEQIELSERLRKACLGKGITEPRFVAQDCDGCWCHFEDMPRPLRTTWSAESGDMWGMLILMDESTANWRETLMEFNPNAGVPLADVLKRNCEHCGKILANAD